VHLRRIALQEGWEIVHLDRLARRLKIAAGVSGAAAVGALGVIASGRVGTRAGGER
jgi:hypothetical protein